MGGQTGRASLAHGRGRKGGHGRTIGDMVSINRSIDRGRVYQYQTLTPLSYPPPINVDRLRVAI